MNPFEFVFHFSYNFSSVGRKYLVLKNEKSNLDNLMEKRELKINIRNYLFFFETGLNFGKRDENYEYPLNHVKNRIVMKRQKLLMCVDIFSTT